MLSRAKYHLHIAYIAVAEASPRALHEANSVGCAVITESPYLCNLLEDHLHFAWLVKIIDQGLKYDSILKLSTKR